jgi:hypothetical protein
VEGHVHPFPDRTLASSAGSWYGSSMDTTTAYRVEVRDNRGGTEFTCRADNLADMVKDEIAMALRDGGELVELKVTPRAV